MMLRWFTRKYSTRDIVEEYRSIPVCPLVDGSVVADDAWAEDNGGIPCPDWTKAFGFTSTVSSLVPFGGFLHSSYVSEAASVERLKKKFIRSAEEKES
jgi:hypothetical protein